MGNCLSAKNGNSSSGGSKGNTKGKLLTSTEKQGAKELK